MFIIHYSRSIRKSECNCACNDVNNTSTLKRYLYLNVFKYRSLLKVEEFQLSIMIKFNIVEVEKEILMFERNVTDLKMFVKV